jgi:peptidoglycan hydrolase-like protein with peptidoglycan-binding domain
MLKKFLIGTFAVAVFAIAGTAAAYDFGPTTLKVGSTGVYVSTLQTLVGATADGSFGPMTKAKVQVWQAANGLTADGAFGALSKAKANATSTTTTTVAGCPAGALFNSLTGASCTTTTTTTTTVTGLTGGAGDIALTSTSTDVESEVVEGNTEKVLGFKIEAEDSDIAVTNAKVSFKITDAAVTAGASYRLSDYASTVEVYQGSKKVGEADVSDFSKDVHTYTKSIALSNAVVKEGDKDAFYIVVKADSGIDGDDIDHNDWDVTVNSLRYQDATGIIMTATTLDSDAAITEDFTFTDLADSGDLKLTYSKATSSPSEGNVEVSDTGTTADVLMLAFKLKATGSDMSFDQVTVDLLRAGVPNTKAGVEMIFDELVLKNGSDVIATLDTADSSTAATFDLDDTFTIDQDSTESFNVYAKIKEISTTADEEAAAFSQGDSLKVSLSQTGITAEDSNGDTVTGTYESGAATGSAQTFYSQGINTSGFTSGTPSVTTNDTTGKTVDASYAISFKVTAMGNPYYILKNGAVVGADMNGDTADGLPSFAPLGASNATSSDTYWLIEEGDTATFTTTGVISASNAVSGFNKITLSTLAYDVDGAGGTAAASYTFAPSTSYETTSVNFNK